MHTLNDGISNYRLHVTSDKLRHTYYASQKSPAVYLANTVNETFRNDKKIALIRSSKTSRLEEKVNSNSILAL